ncbi:MAG: UvrD-helicase domain-containing protein [Chloroflexota bacterium]|nr:UvrD-helicase domain-containing protein [Chloroflexota bacterium]
MTTDALEARARDQQTREQMRRSTRTTLFVEAGAGTGKTRALVDQIVALILGGTAIDRMVAITFTEKAAGELRDRVRSRLEEARDEHAAEAGLIDGALRSLDRAQISTIHAFGLTLLRNFAAECGIDPAFEVQDEVLAERRLQERWRGYLEALSDPDAAEAVDRALGLGLTTRHLWTLAQELARRPGLAARLAARPLVAPTPMWPNVERYSAQLHDLRLDRAPDSDPLRRRVEELAAVVDRILHAGDGRESVLAAGAPKFAAKFKVSNAAAWGTTAEKESVQETGQSVAAALAGLLANCRASALADILPLVVRFVLDDAAVRARDGTLTFDDLILRPHDLLAEDPEAARVLRARYDVMLIDEFQDTDPLQVEMALAFATDPDTGELEPGRLFLVGDPKQSIYRFRRADMAIYAATGARVRDHGGAFPALQLNRRSRSVIVEWVNMVFANIIGAGDRPEIQPPYRQIEADRADKLAGPGVAVIGGPSAERAAEVKQREAGAIASYCSAAVSQEWQVAERDGTVRPASYRDIAILIPTRNILIPLQRSLERAGIPYRIEGGSLIYQTQEVRDLLNCLTAIDDPADEVAVVGALRSTAFACSDVDLARHRAGGGRFDYLHVLEDRRGVVADALRELDRYHELRHRGSIAELVERFVSERGLEEIGVLVDASRDSFRRMRFVIEQARSFEAAGPESLRSFVAWLEQRAGKDMLDNEGTALDDDEDAVRVLTVHGSKGLEFPIVFVGGLSAAPNTRAPVYALEAVSERVAVSVGAKTQNAVFELGDTDALHQDERDHAEAEFDRLLYVAATRARDHLVLSLYHSSKGAKGQCGAARIMAGLGGLGVTALPELAAPLQQPRAPFADLEVELPPGLSDGTFDVERAALILGARTHRYTSATALGPDQMQKPEASDETEPWARGRGGTHLGRAVHATIQSVPLDASAAQIAAFSRAQSVAEAIPGRDAEVAALVQSALASKAFGRARAASRAMREVPFVVQYGATVLEGFIDMVIEGEDGGIEIVDWKTDHVAGADVPQRLKQYESQAGLYVLGLEAATGRTVTRVTYVFASSGVEESPGEPAILAEAARALL